MAKFTGLPEGFVEISEEEIPGTLPPGDIETSEKQVFESLPEGFIEIPEEALQPSERKSFKEAAIHGLRGAGLTGIKGLAGLAKMEAEVGGKLRGWMWEKLGREQPKYLQKLNKALGEWGNEMSAAVDQAIVESPEELMQLESEGFLGQTWEILTKPELLLQGGIESSVLMLEAGLGTLLGGPGGGIIAMTIPRAGEVYADARKEGDSPNTALARSWATALPEAAIEQWTFGRKLGLVKKITSKTPMRKALWEFGKLYWRGTAEEGSQQFNQNFWRWVFTDRSQSWWEGIPEAAAAGGPIEAAMGGVFAGTGVVGRMVPDAIKRQRVNTVRKTFNEAPNLTEEQKTEINEALDKTIDAINTGKYAQAITANQAIGLQYGLSPQDVDKRFSDAELRYRELKRKDTAKRTKNEKEELTFLKRNRTNIEALLEQETKPIVPGTLAIKPKTKSKATLRVLAHKIAKESDISKQDYADYAEIVTGKRSMKDMSKKEMKEFVTALEESYGSPSEITPEDYGIPIQVGDKTTTMGILITRAAKTAKELSAKKEIPKVVPKGFREKGRGAAAWVKGVTVGIDNTPIFHLAHILDQAGDGVFTEILDTNLERGRKIETGHGQVVHSYLENGLKEAGIDATDLAKMSKTCNPRITIPFTEITLGAGTDILTEKINNRSYEMTWGDLIDFYLTSNQEDGLRHLKKGGAVINGVKTGSLSDKIIADLRLRVEANPKAKAITDLILEIGESTWRPTLNETSQRLEGRDIATIPNWWGLRVYMPKRLPGKQVKFATGEAIPGINLIEDKSILRPRTKSTAPLVINDAFNKFVVFEKAISEYVGMAGPTRTARTLINNSDLASALNQKGYGKVRGNILKILNRAQTGRREAGIFSAFFRQYMPALYRAVLHFNPRVIVSQFTSAANYGAYASPKYLPGLMKGLDLTGKSQQETLDISGVAWDRFYMGHSSLELGEMAKLDTTLRFWTKKSADINKLGIGLKLADLAALTSGVEIAKREYQDAQTGTMSGLSAQWWVGKDVSAEKDSLEWRQAITERAEWLWQKTQPSWDKWNRSVITSQTGAEKMFLLFRSFHEKSLTICHEAMLDYKNSAKMPEDKLRVAGRIGSVMAGYTTNVFLRALITIAMTRKLKEPLKYLEDFVTSWTRMFPFFGRALDTTIRRFIDAATGLKPEYRGEAIEALPLTVVNNLLRSPANFTTAMVHALSDENEKAKKAAKRGMRQLWEGLGPICGLPTYEINRILKGWVKPYIAPEEEKRETMKRGKTQREYTKR